MPRKSILAIAVLLGLLITVGYAEAADRGTSERSVAVRGDAPAPTQVQSTGSVSLTKLLHLRFLATWKMLADLEEARPEPGVFGTNGLSDGPDPIDGRGQAGGANPPTTDKTPDNQTGDDGSGNDEGSSFDET